MAVVRDTRLVLPRGAREFCRLALALRPRPVILASRADGQKSRRNASEKFVLVERHFALAIGPKGIVETEPVLECADDLRDVLGLRTMEVV